MDKDIKDNTEELFEACLDGNIGVVEEILRNKKVDINGSYRRGDTPLMCAVKNGHLNVVRRLLEVPGIKIDKSDDDGDTALFYACLFNRVSVLKLLCQDSRCSPSLVNKMNSRGNTALMTAVIMGHLDIVKELDK